MMKKRACSFLLLLLLLATMLSIPAYAEEGKVTAEVPVEIQLSGSVPSPAETFTVELEAVTENAPMPAGAAEGVWTTTITGAGKATVQIDYEHAGVYSYTIKQLPGSHVRGTYDSRVYKLTVYATVDEDFALGITTVLEDPDGEKTDTALFENSYKAPEPAKYDPPIQKAVQNRRGMAPADSVFTFAMIPAEKDAPMPDNKEARTDEATGALYMDVVGPGSYEFGWMTFTEEHVGKTYVYTVKEVAGSDKYFSYDVNIYTLTIAVTEVDGKVTLDVSRTDNSGTEATSMSFTNVYDRPTEPGKAPKTGDANNIWIWIALMAASVVIIAVGAVIWARKHKKK